MSHKTPSPSQQGMSGQQRYDVVTSYRCRPDVGPLFRASWVLWRPINPHRLYKWTLGKRFKIKINKNKTKSNIFKTDKGRTGISGFNGVYDVWSWVKVPRNANPENRPGVKWAAQTPVVPGQGTACRGPVGGGWGGGIVPSPEENDFRLFQVLRKSCPWSPPPPPPHALFNKSGHIHSVLISPRNEWWTLSVTLRII